MGVPEVLLTSGLTGESSHNRVPIWRALSGRGLKLKKKMKPVITKTSKEIQRVSADVSRTVSGATATGH